MSDETNAAKLFMAALAYRIRGWREALEVSQASVAERSGLPITMILCIEAGTIDPRTTTLWALASGQMLQETPSGGPHQSGLPKK